MREEKLKIALVVFGSIFMVCFCITPFIYMMVVAFSETAEFLSPQVPYKLTLHNYYTLFTSRSLYFFSYLRNSIIVSLMSALGAVAIASGAAYALTRLSLPARAGILFSILVVSLFPQISLVGYLFKVMTHLGWINTYRALLFPYIAWILPISVWILTSYFAQIPKDLDRAALIDGCTRWQILRKVILPVAAPGILSVFLLSFIFAFNEFMFALMLTTDFKARTIPVGIALFQGLHGEIPWGQIMAASSIAILPVVIITVFFQRYIIGGLTRGAVKG